LKTLILYSELAEYTISCLRALKQKSEVDLMLVHWPLNPEAPFKFDLSFCDRVISREALTDEKLLAEAEAFGPDLILSSGWMDKGYLSVCQKQRCNAVTVLSMDNHWNGTVKQHMARLVSTFTIKRAFSHAFVPGQVQKEYALKLGFDSKRIKTGFYAADVDKFEGYHQALVRSKGTLPKRFLYLGRYVRHKGIFDLWEAFTKLQKTKEEWELWCVGTGDEYENRVQHPNIKHFGFIQPSELMPILKETSIYILPSHFEPWGVSVQEMGIAGFPLLLSDKIGSKEAFLKEGENGYVFKSGSADEIFQAMDKVTDLSESALLDMSNKSHDLGMLNTPEKWADTLTSFL
jgi:glycosyltransferase involved in cell wall biosynthesis